MTDPRTDTTTPDPGLVEILLDLISSAYEAAADASDRDLIDFSLIGAPLAKAIDLLRAEP